MNPEHLLKVIENTRKEMIESAHAHGLSANQTIITSQKLDKLLNAYDNLTRS